MLWLNGGYGGVSGTRIPVLALLVIVCLKSKHCPRTPLMFSHILVPVDMAHANDLKKAVQVAADQAKLYDAKATLVSVVGGLQAKVSNSSGKYSKKLAEFAAGVSELHDVTFESIVYEVPDPAVQVDGTVLKVVNEIGADLIIMASHQPGWAEYLVNSHGGRVASHAPVSVFVVRKGA